MQSAAINHARPAGFMSSPKRAGPVPAALFHSRVYILFISTPNIIYSAFAVSSSKPSIRSRFSSPQAQSGMSAFASVLPNSVIS